MKKKIVVIDYGIGNVTSVINAVNWLGYDVRVSREDRILRDADLLIMPGVGSFGEGMHNLIKFKIKDLLDELVLVIKKPIIGICLGMQMMADSSLENGYNIGLGWIHGEVKKLELAKEFRIPHVGWNNVSFLRISPLSQKLTGHSDFYFDHSYHFICDNVNDILATADYDVKITAAINRENIWGVQFHPEKSQNNGLKLFRGIIDSI